VQLYLGSTKEFVTDSIQHRIAEKLGDAYYEYFRFRASVSEFNSWQNSLTALTANIQYARLLDHGIILELQLPLSSARLDVLLTGHDDQRRQNAVIIELKQWSSVTDSEIDDCVRTHLGGAERDVPHPSVQAGNYRQYLADMNSAFSEPVDPITLDACTWLHNLEETSQRRLLAPRFADALSRAPLFAGHDADQFNGYLLKRLSGGSGRPILDRIAGGRLRPSKGLMSHAASVIAGDPVYTLLDEQIVAYNLVLGMTRRGLRTKGHAVAVIKGGPGTGKSVLALNLMAQLLKESKNVQHATGSRAFTGNLRRRLGTRTRPLLQYFNSYAAADPGTVDVLVMDEAHRIRETSNDRYTPRSRRSERSQVEELIRAARVSVFFLDDFQTVRPGEIGSTTLIRETAAALDAHYQETELRTQFRCGGSEQYVAWVDQLLEIRKTGTNELHLDEGFDFQIVDDPAELDRLIRLKATEGHSARLTAGFCWPWSKAKSDGTLVDDVQIGGFQRPWNARPEATKLARGIPKADVWAGDPNGLDQVGCVYTAQGFEFDYVGVIFGRDLRYDPVGHNWTGVPAESYDQIVRKRSGARFTDCVKNAYRVLLTRGMKGCYVYFVDQQTRDYVDSRIS
jgi:DUF2075 family protein